MRTFPYKHSDSNYIPTMPVRVLSTTIRKQKKIQFRLDTGADITVIPIDILDVLEAAPHRLITIRDYDSNIISTSLYIVNVAVNQLVFESVYVVPSLSGNALLGLDIINRLDLTLSGSTRTLILH